MCVLYLLNTVERLLTVTEDPISTMQGIDRRALDSCLVSQCPLLSCRPSIWATFWIINMCNGRGGIVFQKSNKRCRARCTLGKDMIAAGLLTTVGKTFCWIVRQGEVRAQAAYDRERDLLSTLQFITTPCTVCDFRCTHLTPSDCI